MTDLLRWLESRRPAAPPSLRVAMREVVERADPGPGSLHDRLAIAGLDAVRRVVAEPSTRDHALELLAADALITYACEAALEAEDGAGDTIDILTRKLDPARFAGLLPEDGEA